MTPELMAKVADLMEDIENGEHRYGHFHNPPSCAEHAEAILAPDGPIMEFFGPAVRALGSMAVRFARVEIGWTTGANVDRSARRWLGRQGIAGPLADLCLELAGEAS